METDVLKVYDIETDVTENASIYESAYESDDKIVIIVPEDTQLEKTAYDNKFLLSLEKPIKSTYRGLKNKRNTLLHSLVTFSILTALISVLGKNIQSTDRKKIHAISLPSTADDQALADIGLLKAKKKFTERIGDKIGNAVYGKSVELRLTNFTENGNDDITEIDGEVTKFESFHILQEDVVRGLLNSETNEAFFYLTKSDGELFENERLIANKMLRALRKDGERASDVAKRAGIRIPIYYAQNETKDDDDDDGDDGNEKTKSEGKPPQISILYPFSCGRQLHSILNEGVTLDERLYIARHIILSLTHLHADGIAMDGVDDSISFFALPENNAIFVEKLFVYNDPDRLTCQDVNGTYYGEPQKWSMDVDKFFIKKSQENIKELGILISTFLPELQNEQHFVNKENGNAIIKEDTFHVFQSNEKFVEKMKRWGELVQILQSASANTVLKLPNIFAEFPDILGK